MRSPRLLAVVLAALVMALAACSSEPPSVSEQTLRAIEADNTFSWTPQAGNLDLGVTHTEDSLDPEEPDAARQRGMDILSTNGGSWQNVHLMGFGTNNPEPSPGQYDWDTLDQRMQLVEETGGRTVLTACCAPDWMKGGQAGKTDWSRLEAEPQASHFADYANLVAATVERYPQIERVLVWNELKGFYHQEDNRWDYEGYTDLYNQIYRAVKAVRSDVEVGGPYVVLTSLDPGTPDSSDVSGPWGVADQRALDVVEYWLQNNVGADFLAVDGSTSTRQDTVPKTVDQGAQKFADLTTWLRARRPTYRSGGRSSTRTCPRARKEPRTARPARSRRSRRWPRTPSPAPRSRCCGARRGTGCSTPRSGPTAPRTTAGSRRRSPRPGSGSSPGSPRVTWRSAARARSRSWCSARPTARWS